MKTNLMALGQTFLFFGYVGIFMLAVHYLGQAVGIDPMYIFLTIFLGVVGVFMFQIQRARILANQENRNITITE